MRLRRDADAGLKPRLYFILLALAAGERHGLAIAREVDVLSGGQVRLWPATLYGSLDELHDTGWIDEVDDPDERPQESEKRRIFRLSAAGRRVLSRGNRASGRPGARGARAHQAADESGVVTAARARLSERIYRRLLASLPRDLVQRHGDEMTVDVPAVARPGPVVEPVGRHSVSGLAPRRHRARDRSPGRPASPAARPRRSSSLQAGCHDQLRHSRRLAFAHPPEVCHEPRHRHAGPGHRRQRGGLHAGQRHLPAPLPGARAGPARLHQRDRAEVEPRVRRDQLSRLRSVAQGPATLRGDRPARHRDVQPGRRPRRSSACRARRSRGTSSTCCECPRWSAARSRRTKTDRTARRR